MPNNKICLIWFSCQRLFINFCFRFRQPIMKVEDLMLRFPHLPEQIFQKLDNKNLFKCREVAKSWQNLIDGRNYPWLRIVNIPTRRTKDRPLECHVVQFKRPTRISRTGQNRKQTGSTRQRASRREINEEGERAAGDEQRKEKAI